MLAMHGVSFGYGNELAVRDVSVTIDEGQLVALTGPNGSGKSTLLKMAARVVTPSAGEVRLEGRPLAQWRAKEYARRTSYLPQSPEPAFPMRALDVVVSGRAPFLERFAWESAADYVAARDALALCDASHLAERDLDEMSGGERQRVFLARVLAGAPRLILLDEPFAALDVSHVQQFSALLRDVVRRTGCTVLFASHDLNWAGAYSDRMLVMRGGVLAADGVPRDVMRPERISELFGFEAEAVDVNGRLWLVPRA